MGKQTISAIAAAVACCSFTAPATAACTIVLGKGWAFAISVPGGWSSICGPEAPGGTALFLWPANQSEESQAVYLYVTASVKANATLAEYVTNSQKQFTDANPNAKITRVESQPHRSFAGYETVQISNSRGAREEIVAYVEAPTAFFTVAITAASESLLQQHKTTYFELLASMLPMERR